jgi:hypothetical protein
MRNVYLLLLAGVITFAGGCKKKEQAATETATAAPEAVTPQAPTKPAKPGTRAEQAPPDVLPGATDVRNALASKDYVGAVERLGVLKSIAVNEELYRAYRELSAEVGLVLDQAAKTDPKAREALGSYRLMMFGR